MFEEMCPEAKCELMKAKGEAMMEMFEALTDEEKAEVMEAKHAIMADMMADMDEECYNEMVDAFTTALAGTAIDTTAFDENECFMQQLCCAMMDLSEEEQMAVMGALEAGLSPEMMQGMMEAKEQLMIMFLYLLMKGKIVS